MDVRVVTARIGHGNQGDDDHTNPIGVEHLVWMAVPRPLEPDGLQLRHQLEIPVVQELRRERRLFREDVVKFERDVRSPVREIESTIPLLRLHCPKHEGCTAKETLSLSSEANLTIRLNLPGLVQGSTIELDIVTDQTWSTEDGRCLEVVMPTTLTLTYGQFLFNDEPMAIGFNLALKDFDEDLQIQREIPAGDDLCLLSDLSGATPISGRSRIMTGATQISIETKTVVRGRQELGITVLGEPLGVSIGYERASATGATREYHLAAEAEYQAYVPDEQTAITEAAEIFWRTHEFAGRGQARRRQAAKPRKQGQS